MRSAVLSGLATMFAAAAVASAQPVVLYDSLWIVDEDWMDAGTGNAIGGSRPFGNHIDSQMADDFDLDREHRLTTIVADLMSHDGTVPAAEGIWVQIYGHHFEDDGPVEEVLIEHVVAPGDVVAEPIDTPLSFEAWRVTLDVSALGIELGAGTWWMSVQPIDIDVTGDWFWWIGSISVPTIGFRSHVRDAGQAHGNGFGGLWSSDTWIPHDFRGNNTVSMRIEGEAICTADLDGDGVLDVNDFFLYLDLFAAGDARADLDGDGDVDVNDFFAYLDLFAAGCD